MIPDVDRDVKQGENVVDGSGGDHEAGVDRPAHDTTQRVPRPATITIVNVMWARKHC